MSDMSDLGDLEHDPGISAADLRVLRSAATGEGLIPLTPSSLSDLMEMAKETRAYFEEVMPSVTPDQAAFVRRLRVDEGYSWRAVAETCHIEWAGTWEPPSNQIMGMILCERAAEVFGEDPDAPPWN